MGFRWEVGQFGIFLLVLGLSWLNFGDGSQILWWSCNSSENFARKPILPSFPFTPLSSLFISRTSLYWFSSSLSISSQPLFSMWIWWCVYVNQNLYECVLFCAYEWGVFMHLYVYEIEECDVNNLWVCVNYKNLCVRYAYRSFWK